jgi:hypothetical protein
MKKLNQLIELMEDPDKIIIVNPIIIETLKDIRTLVNEMETKLDRITDDGK